MSRAFLIFATALVALMAGALFYAARMPVDVNESAPAAQAPRTENIEPAAAPVREAYPSFTLPDADGNIYQLSDWDGKHRILNFWATWCAPCRREIPLLKDLQDQHGDAGFQVIGIAVDFPEEVSSYAEAAEFNYPVVVGQQEAMAVAESSGIEFVGLPFTMFVATDGELLSAYIGELHQPQLDTVVEVMKKLELGELSKDEARTALDNL